MEGGYIHINQAVRTYNKTRQTFYNYIKKGVISTKKVNNKLFLNIGDIKNAFSDYYNETTDSDSGSTVGELIETNQNSFDDTHQSQENIESQKETFNTLFRYQKGMLNEFNFSLTQKVDATYKEIYQKFLDTQRNHMKKSDTLENTISTLIESQKKQHIEQNKFKKKSYFLLWFLIGTLVNIGFLIFLFN